MKKLPIWLTLLTSLTRFCGCWSLIWHHFSGDVFITQVTMATTEVATVAKLVGVMGLMIWDTHT